MEREYSSLLTSSSYDQEGRRSRSRWRTSGTNTKLLCVANNATSVMVEQKERRAKKNPFEDACYVIWRFSRALVVSVTVPFSESVSSDGRARLFRSFRRNHHHVSFQKCHQHVVGAS